MTLRKELIDYLNALMKPEEFEDYLPNGLQIEGKVSVEKVVTSPSCSLKTVEYAATIGADMLFVHHGLFWKNEERTLTGPLKKKIKLILENEINLVAYHLPLDSLPEFGNNHSVLKQIGAKNILPFAKIGYIGELAEAKSEDEFFQMMDTFYETSGVHISSELNRPVQKVAVVSGGGASYFRDAVTADADAFITGEGSEWVYSVARENGISFSAMGHYNTEKIGPRLIGEELQRRFDVDCHFFSEENPF